MNNKKANEALLNSRYRTAVNEEQIRLQRAFLIGYEGGRQISGMSSWQRIACADGINAAKADFDSLNHDQACEDAFGPLGQD